MMNRRQFFVLFLCNLIPWWVGSGLVSLLPIYAAQLGASPAMVGNYLSLVFLGLAAGTWVGGWVAGKVRNLRQLMMTLAMCSAVAIFLMGQVGAIWQLILLSIVAWFACGVSISLVMILVGEQTEAGKRGQTFGLLTLASSLGGVLGGVTGFIVDHWGFTWLFTLAGATWLVQVCAASFLHNPRSSARRKEDALSNQAHPQMGEPAFATAFLLLFVGALLVSIGSFAGFLGRTLTMEAQGFSNSTITLLAAFGSALGLVVNPLLGRMSDRGGRRWLLAALYVMGACALVVTAYARTATDFVLVAILLACSTAERGISVALVSDVVPSDALSRSLARFDSVKWLGGVVGMAGTGYAIAYLGLANALLVGALLPLLAALLLLGLREGKVRAEQVPTPQLDPA